jgi:hypothetical protein
VLKKREVEIKLIFTPRGVSCHLERTPKELLKLGVMPSPVCGMDSFKEVKMKGKECRSNSQEFSRARIGKIAERSDFRYETGVARSSTTALYEIAHRKKAAGQELRGIRWQKHGLGGGEGADPACYI